MEWEIFTINIYHQESDRITDREKEEITAEFESKLFRLIKQYQGRGGLAFEAKNSENQPIVES